MSKSKILHTRKAHYGWLTVLGLVLVLNWRPPLQAAEPALEFEHDWPVIQLPVDNLAIVVQNTTNVRAEYEVVILDAESGVAGFQQTQTLVTDLEGHITTQTVEPKSLGMFHIDSFALAASVSGNLVIPCIKIRFDDAVVFPLTKPLYTFMCMKGFSAMAVCPTPTSLPIKDPADLAQTFNPVDLARTFTCELSLALDVENICDILLQKAKVLALSGF